MCCLFLKKRDNRPFIFLDLVLVFVHLFVLGGGGWSLFGFGGFVLPKQERKPWKKRNIHPENTFFS